MKFVSMPGRRRAADKSVLVVAGTIRAAAEGRFVGADTCETLLAVTGAMGFVPNARLATFFRGTVILPNVSLSNTTASADTDNTLPEKSSPFCICNWSARSQTVAAKIKTNPDETNRSLVLMRRA